MCKFIDLETLPKDLELAKVTYQRNFVNISHIVRIEKLSKSEESRIVVHLIDGTQLCPSKTYKEIMKNIAQLTD